MSDEFEKGDTVLIGEDTGIITDVDRVNSSVLIEYQGGSNDGLEEWRKMSEFEKEDEST